MSGRRNQRLDHTVRLLLILWTLFGCCWISRVLLLPDELQQLTVEAARNLSFRRYDETLRLAERALELSPDSAPALLLAGSAAAELAEPELSASLLRRIPTDSPWAVSAGLRLGRGLMQRGRVEEAEHLFAQIVEQDPANAEANRRLAILLQSEGRVWESTEFLGRLLFQGDFGGNELFMMSSPERYFRIDPQLLETLASEVPGDPLIRLGEIRLKLIESRAEGVRPLLEELVELYPQLAEPRARLGHLTLDSGDPQDFLQWNDGVTFQHLHHPEIWFVRGLYLRRQNQLPSAARCFLETLLRLPHHPGANYQLSGCLQQLGQIERASEFSNLVPMLSQLDRELNIVRDAPTEENMGRVVSLLLQLGRRWEAAGWAHVARQLHRQAIWPRRVLRTECRKLSFSQGLVDRETQPALRLELSDYPLPDWRAESPVLRHQQTSVRPQTTNWRFADVAQLAGIDFTYTDGTSRRDRMRHVIETLGGGMGIIDFDGDGWPDLYLPQGNSWRQQDVAQPDALQQPLDRLYRNLADGQFQDVTELSGIREGGMSHGVSVGDIDGDGLADIHVTNLGANSLFRNNGDGTFSEISMSAGIQGDDWSTSSAIADLTGDGLPDVFVVNYLDMEHVLQYPCYHRGLEVGCPPDALPPGRSRFYVNLGDGRFQDVSVSAGISTEAGNGLGLIVADFHDEGCLSVFVGNDSTPNFLFRNRCSDFAGGDPGKFRLYEEGVTAGVAFNGRGSVMASMGIAAGDANSDGRLDLFVTTYRNDADTLFVQQAEGFFSDVTRQARLDVPTSSLLGFGTQFIDVDNNGMEDLVATYGHVIPPQPDEPDDERDLMPTLVLANRGDGTFDAVSPESLGPFFQFRGLGRGLAEFDWNRDGRQDFCISWLHSPLTLLSNQTPLNGHRLVIRLVGTLSSRDATGTVATVHTKSRILMRQLTAGDGYLVSNERHLWFGLGPESAVNLLVIKWPSGLVQQFENLAGDRELMIVEGRASPVVLREYHP